MVHLIFRMVLRLQVLLQRQVYKRITSLNVTGGHVNVGTNIQLGDAGIITATYRGDGGQLTGIDATSIQTGNTSVQTTDTGSDGQIKFTTEGTLELPSLIVVIFYLMQIILIT